MIVKNGWVVNPFVGRALLECCPPSRRSQARTLTAIATAATATCVPLVELVSMLAMRLGRVLRRCANASQHILPKRDWLQMIRAAAGWVAAMNVVDLQGAYRTEHGLVEEAMRTQCLAANTKDAVSILVTSTLPLPASFPKGHVDGKPLARREMLVCAADQGIAVALPAGIVPFTPCSTVAFSVAIGEGARRLARHLEIILSGVTRATVTAVRPHYFTCWGAV